MTTVRRKQSARSLFARSHTLSLGVNLLGHNGNSQDGRMKVLIWFGVATPPHNPTRVEYIS